MLGRGVSPADPAAVTPHAAAPSQCKGTLRSGELLAKQPRPGKGSGAGAAGGRAAGRGLAGVLRLSAAQALLISLMIL